MLSEDANLREDKDRLDKCRRFIAGLSAVEITAVVPEIVELLHDKWSEVRSACAKSLSKIPNSYNERLCNALLESAHKATQWQDIHGCVLGLTAMASWADGTENSQVLDQISSLCLILIGHTNIPIKEASRNCLKTVQQRVPHKEAQIGKMVGAVQNIIEAPYSESEANTLTLDGLLGCLVDNYQLYPQLVPDGSEGSQLTVVQILKACALHPASTVRQKAGQILTLFVLTFKNHHGDAEPPAEVPTTVRVITSLLMEALRTASAEHWCVQEISLMVAEELVGVVTEHQLHTLEVHSRDSGIDHTERGANTPFITHMTRFLCFLKDHLHHLLAHEQYEVRRMAVQLTPQLARAFILLNTPALDVTEGVGSDGLAAVDHALNIATGGEQGTTGDLVSEQQVEDDPEDDEEADEQRNMMRCSSSSIEADNPSHSPSPSHSRDSGDASPGPGPGPLRSSQDISSAQRPRSLGRPTSLQVVLNSSFRGPRGEITSFSAAGRLDLPLIVRMVWLAELIKENQHFFETYALSDEWRSSSVTKDLQMRSTKEGAPGHMGKYFTETPRHTSTGSEGAAAALKDGCTRNAVDNWSLDVRGRLQEIEKRAQFHRTVKNLVASSLETNSSVVVSLLVSNCTAILSLVESIITEWNALLVNDPSDGSVASTALMASLATFRSVVSTSNTPTVLSADFVECLGLVDSFLLSVELRLSQCPDISTVALSPHLDELPFLVSSAESHRRELDRLKVHWIRKLAQIQCVSRCSTHVSNRSGITGHSTARATASELLLTLHAPGQVSARANRDLFTSSLGADPEARVRALQSTASPLGETLTRLLDRLRVDARTSKDTNGPSSSASVADIYTEMMTERVVLTTSLTNAAVDIAHFEHLARHSSSALPDLAYLQTPSHILSYPIGGTPHSSAKVVYTPSAFTFSSPGGPCSNSHAQPPSSASGASLVHRYQAMDQWNCEAVSPLLTCLSGGAVDAVQGIDLAAVVVEWIASCVLHPLWLDCRHNARRYLFESLALLLSRAETSAASTWSDAAPDIGPTVRPEESLRCLLLLRVLRAIAEVLVLRAAKPLLDVKSAVCLVRAGTAAVKLFRRYWGALCAHCSEQPQVVQELLELDVRPLASECSERIIAGTEYYRAAYPAPPPAPSHAEILQRQLSQGKKEPGSPSRNRSRTNSPATVDPDPVVEEDEFSDWDEDSDADEEQVHLADTDLTNGAISIAQIFAEEAMQLCHAVTNLLA